MSKNVEELLESIALLEQKKRDCLNAPVTVYGMVLGAQTYLNNLLMQATKGVEDEAE